MVMPPRNSCPVIPAQAGIQKWRHVSLDPRLREDDTPELQSSLHILVEISPNWIQTFNESEFPRPVPMFNLLFPCNSFVDVGICLIPNQVHDIVARGKRGSRLASMFVNTPREIVCYSAIESAISAAGKQIDIVGAVHKPILAACAFEFKRSVIPAQTGIQFHLTPFLDPRLREDDKRMNDNILLPGTA
jgi:hypothetical protein